MQIAIETRGTQQPKLFDAVSEAINKIDSSTYLQWGVVLSIIMLVAWSITFKVTTEAQIHRLEEKNDEMSIQLAKLQTTLPSRDWLELKFNTLEEQLGSKSKSK
jgi:hypothetical protein